MASAYYNSNLFLSASKGFTMNATVSKGKMIHFMNCLSRKFLGILHSSRQQQNNDDQEKQGEPTNGTISPPGAIRPGRQGAYQKDDYDDEEDDGHLLFSALLMLGALRSASR